MLTEIRNAETGELLEKGDMPSYYVVGEAIEVNGVRRTIDRIEEYTCLDQTLMLAYLIFIKSSIFPSPKLGHYRAPVAFGHLPAAATTTTAGEFLKALRDL